MKDQGKFRNVIKLRHAFKETVDLFLDMITDIFRIFVLVQIKASLQTFVAIELFVRIGRLHDAIGVKEESIARSETERILLVFDAVHSRQNKARGRMNEFVSPLFPS